MARRLGLLVTSAFLLAASASAHPESAAPSMREDVVAVGHAPDVPAPGTQWTASIEFRPGHDVDSVLYQVCEVGNVCFGPPTGTQRDGDRFWFDTSSYALDSAGRPVAWGIGDGRDWAVGYKFVIQHANGTSVKFPQGIPYGTPDCDALGHVECDATNYFVFTIPGAVADKGAPWPAVPWMLALIALAWRRR